MSNSRVRRFAALILAAGAVTAMPGATLATVEGGCTAEGHSTSTSVDLTTATEWHLRSTDTAGGSGTAPVKMTSAQVAAYGLGIPLPIAGGTSETGETEGSVEGVSVATYAILGSRFVVAGSASGEGAPCSGSVTIILDDVNPLFTILGGGGLLVFLVALLVVFFGARSAGGCLMQIIGALFGGLGGIGLGLSLEQFGVLDPTVPFGVGIAIGFAVLAFIVTGRLHPQLTMT